MEELQIEQIAILAALQVREDIAREGGNPSLAHIEIWKRIRARETELLKERGLEEQITN